jgi:16S rRNA (guanine966-N2)-methyltransferase
LRAAGKSGRRAAGAPRRAGASRVLRIIGGTWRGRKLRFPAGPDIRPTPDRVRETLFNWLGARVPGARCLDLFAGSGALGLEALSRGAAHVTFIEHDPRAARELSAHLSEWGASGARVECQDALAFLRGTAGNPFDIAFLDPPFASGLIAGAAQLLTTRGWLSPGARLYVECAASDGAPVLPATLAALKAKQAGEVGYHLYEYLPAGTD